MTTAVSSSSLKKASKATGEKETIHLSLVRKLDARSLACRCVRNCQYRRPVLDRCTDASFHYSAGDAACRYKRRFRRELCDEPEVLTVMMIDSEFSTLPFPVALVVDDEPLIRMDTADIVADEGYHVLEARTADEAFAFLREHHSLKLVFTDIQMPGEMNGLALAQRISEEWPSICVIVASGAVSPPEGTLPATARFIPKPINAQLVQETLRELCP